MSRKLNKQLVLATALALGASSVALADDSSMSRIGGDSYAYFNQPVLRNAAANPTWRQSHPNGPTERELQALSSSTLAAWQMPSGSGYTASASTDQADVAQNPGKETFTARLARFLHPESGTQEGTKR